MNHQAVVDLGFGDSGKGSTVDFLCAEAQEEGRPINRVVRFNGGHQAAHNVVMADGRYHTFSQYGSGTFRGVPTLLTKFMVVEPIGFMRERDHLLEIEASPSLYEATLPLVTVDRECLITTPWHMALNHAAEDERGDKPHGSCGVGFGQTIAYELDYPFWGPRVKDIADRPRLLQKLHALRGHCRASNIPIDNDIDETVAAYEKWANTVVIANSKNINHIISRGPCVFEGAQGVLLDEWHGFHPHTTWSTTTYENINDLVGKDDEVERLGVLRSYTTRHGAGPLPTESDVLTTLLREAHNDDAGKQGEFRCGDFDAVAHEYAVRVCGRVDGLVVTHMDALDKANLRICWAYMKQAKDLLELEIQHPHNLAAQERVTKALFGTSVFSDSVKNAHTMLIDIQFRLKVPVVLTSWGPTAEDKRRELTRV